MKKGTFSARIMKAGATLALIGLVISGLMLSSFRSQKLADDIWKALGISKQAGSEKIKNSFMNGYLDHYGMRNLKNIAMNERAAIAKDLLQYTKDFVSSPAFKKEYDKMRSNAKPEELELKPLRSLQEIQKDEIAKTEKSIKDTEKSVKAMPEMAKDMQPILDMFKQSLKDYQNPNHEYFKNIALGEKYDQENEIRSHKERTATWEKFYPVNVNDYIAERLAQMLKKTEGIDYDAQLVEKNGKKKFVNSKYEGKGTEWKQGFRAGREVTEMARKFVQTWKDELK